MDKLKPPTTLNQQMEVLRSKGCQITDSAFCKKVLSKVNYYRLSAYFLPFKKSDGTYKPGTDFNKIYQIYEFDRNMRNILFTAIEEVEISLRAEFSYWHGHKYGSAGYLDAANYNSKHRHDEFMNRISAEIHNRRKELFVQHHIINYGGRLPIWVMSELFTFGMLSYFYDDLLTSDQKTLAKNLFNTLPKSLASWLRCCTILRNICAHYGRLYFRIFTAVPANLPGLDSKSERRLFGAVLALMALYPDAEKWNGEIYPRLESLVNSCSGIIILDHIGFPVDWAEKLRKNIPTPNVSPSLPSVLV